jgi:hypothetical protein
MFAGAARALRIARKQKRVRAVSSGVHSQEPCRAGGAAGGQCQAETASRASRLSGRASRPVDEMLTA